MSGVETLEPIGLEALDAAAALRTRVDRKYLLPTADLPDLLDALRDTHAALEIDGRRWFHYDSVYFDTEGLLTARAHVQGRRRRFKCRSRHYVETGRCVFEIKLKGLRGRTLKHQLPIDVQVRRLGGGGSLQTGFRPAQPAAEGAVRGGGAPAGSRPPPPRRPDPRHRP